MPANVRYSSAAERAQHRRARLRIVRWLKGRRGTATIGDGADGPVAAPTVFQSVLPMGMPTLPSGFRRSRKVIVVGWQRGFEVLLRTFDAKLPKNSQLFVVSEQPLKWREAEMANEDIPLNGTDKNRDNCTIPAHVTDRPLRNVEVKHLVGFCTDDSVLRDTPIGEADAVIVNADVDVSAEEGSTGGGGGAELQIADSEAITSTILLRRFRHEAEALAKAEGRTLRPITIVTEFVDLLTRRLLDRQSDLLEMDDDDPALLSPDVAKTSSLLRLSKPTGKAPAPSASGLLGMMRPKSGQRRPTGEGAPAAVGGTTPTPAKNQVAPAPVDTPCRGVSPTVGDELGASPPTVAASADATVEEMLKETSCGAPAASAEAADAPPSPPSSPPAHLVPAPASIVAAAAARRRTKQRRLPSPPPSPPADGASPAKSTADEMVKIPTPTPRVTTVVFHRNYIETTALSLASHSASSWATVQMLLDNSSNCNISSISSFRVIPEDAVKDERLSFCFFEMSDLVVMQDLGLLIGWRHKKVNGGEALVNPPNKKELLDWSVDDELIVICDGDAKGKY